MTGASRGPEEAASGAESAAYGVELVLRNGLRVRVTLPGSGDSARGVAALVTALEAREHVGEDPRGGALFVFVSKSGTRVKVLWWERNGYCLLYKRLHRALFVVPSGHPHDRGGTRIDGPALARLLSGVALDRSERAEIARRRDIDMACVDSA